MKDLEKNENYTNENFESIKHVDENGNEFWYARELMTALGYSKWENFEKVINKAKISYKNAEIKEDYWLLDIRKSIISGKGKTTFIDDYKLSRYACYLIAQNGDSRKKVIALAQTYFAVQTRKQEIFEEKYAKLSEDDKRFYQRDLTRKGNLSLNKTALMAGVKNFDNFHNSGYRGLYNGESANDIAKRKGLRYREDILDNMGSEELAANLFRITQTEGKLKNDKVHTESDANDTHFEVGKEVRETIKKLGGTMPENLPTPEKSLKQLQKERKREELENKAKNKSKNKNH